jgi:predicted nucleic acid-binding protein
MTLVIDASVAVKFLVGESDADRAHELLALRQPLVAPDWILLEVASALQKKVAGNQVSERHAVAAMEALPEFFSNLFAAADLLRGGYRLAFELGHAVYDCLYLELAIELGAVVVTADKEFVTATERGGLAKHIRLLGEAV